MLYYKYINHFLNRIDLRIRKRNKIRYDNQPGNTTGTLIRLK